MFWLTKAQSRVAPYLELFGIHYSTCVPILVLLCKFEQLICYAAVLLRERVKWLGLQPVVRNQQAHIDGSPHTPPNTFWPPLPPVP